MSVQGLTNDLIHYINSLVTTVDRSMVQMQLCGGADQFRTQGHMVCKCKLA